MNQSVTIKSSQLSCHIAKLVLHSTGLRVTVAYLSQKFEMYLSTASHGQKCWVRGMEELLWEESCSEGNSEHGANRSLSQGIVWCT